MLLAAIHVGAFAADLSPEQIEFFESKVRPILVESCYPCHSFEKGKAKADLRLDTRDALRKGGATGAAIVPGDPGKSLLIEAVRDGNEELQMPPKDEGGKLPAGQIAVLEAWVRMGAPDPRIGGKPRESRLGRHFGQALVRTPSDFGVRTEVPLQRELLDWLAASFVEGGWSVKQLHRVIVLSQTYCQSSDGKAQAMAADPDNLLVHRFNRRRLEFEALRDTLLAVSGSLDLKAGGLADDLSKQPFTTRRTVYGFIDRQNLPGMFRTFDYPNPDVSSAQRFATTVSQQALFMMNSPFAQEQARVLVRRPEIAAVAAEPEKIRALYRVLYQRTLDREEVDLALEFLDRPVAPGQAAASFTRWEEFAQVLLLSNELAFD